MLRFHQQELNTTPEAAESEHDETVKHSRRLEEQTQREISRVLIWGEGP